MKKLVFLIFIIPCFSISPAFGQWERTAGPKNQHVTNIAILDNFQVAISDDKVFNRQNSSPEWSSALGIPPEFSVYKVHQTTSAAFVESLSTIFYRTKDGIVWSQLVFADTSIVPNSLFAIGDTLFAEAKIVTASNQYKLLRSIDDGDSWIEVTPPTTVYSIKSVVKEGVNFRIYLRNQPGFGNLQVYQSTDGVNWSFSLQTEYLPNVEFAGRQFFFVYYPAGNFKYSSNNGVSWSSLQTVLKPEGSGVTTFHNDHALFACFLASYRRVEQIYRTYDGINWTTLTNLPALYARPYLIGNTLYAIGDYNQVYSSADNGDTWLTVGNPLPSDFELAGIAFDSDKPLVYGVGGIYNSYPDGTFGMPDHAGIPDVYFYVGDIIKHKGQLIAGGNGLFRSENHGDSWEKINNGTARLPYTFFDASLLFSSENQVVAGGQGRLYHSYDAGELWEPTPNTPEWRDEHGSFCLLSGVEDTLFASKFDSTQYNVYRSFDGGNNWSIITPNDFTGGWGIFYANGLLFLRKADGGSMKVSDNYGITWKNYYNGMFSGFNSFAYTNGQYYAGGFMPNPTEKIILHSTNGKDWNEIVFDTLPGQFKALDIIAEDSLLIVATEYKGVFLSSDEGNTWSNIISEEPGINRVFALEMDSLYLYLATYDGVWRRALTSITTAVKDSPNVFPQSISATPNPASQFISIDLSSHNWDESHPAMLSLFDAKGKKILEKSDYNGDKLNIVSYPEGMYFFSITSGKVYSCGRFIKID